MDKRAGPIMTLCPQCKSIQKADTTCSICKYPIPPKNPPKVDDAGKDNDSNNDHLAAAIWRSGFVALAEYCPLCDVWMPANDPRWQRVVTEPGSYDQPEWVEYICPNCFEQIEEAKLDRALEQKEWSDTALKMSYK